MKDNIPNGWKYAGNEYNNKHNSYETEYLADEEASTLRRTYPKIDFTSIQNIDGRWIIITPIERIYRKKKQKCKCKK